MASLFRGLFERKVPTQASVMSSMMGCSPPSHIGAPIRTPASAPPSPKENYESQVCYEFPKEFTKFLINSSAKGCFVGSLKPLHEKSSNNNFIKKFSRDIERLSNGKYDMILKDTGENLFHLVAPKNHETKGFTSLVVNYFLSFRKLPSVTISGKNYKFLRTDSANADLKKAQKQLEREIYHDLCLKPVVRVATPMNPFPKDKSKKSMTQYCIAQFQDAYNVNRLEAVRIWRLAYYSRIFNGTTTLEDIFKSCQNPRKKINLLVDRCRPLSIPD